MATINNAPLSNEETDKAFNAIKKSMDQALRAGETGDTARSEVIVNCIHIAAHSPTFAKELGSRAVHVFADRKSNASEYDGAWEYFTTLYGLPARVNSEAEPDRVERERHNNKVSAAQQFVRYSASIFYAIEQAHVWQQFSRGKNKSVAMLTIEGAKALFPKRAASLDKSEYNAVAITHRAGEYRFSSIAEAGIKLLEMRGLKMKSTTTRAKPLRDVLAETLKTVEKVADKKSLDAETRRAMLANMVAEIDAMNDTTVTDHLDSKIVAPFRAHLVEKYEALAPKPIAPAKTEEPKDEAAA